MAVIHRPVLVEALLALLQVKPNGIYVDGTLGGGGHAEAVLEKLGTNGLLIGIDRDPESLGRARERLSRHGKKIRFVHANYSEIEAVLADQHIAAVDGIYLDLGFSSDQLEAAARGFSFLREGPLDMRMDVTQGLPLSAKLRQSNPQTLASVLQRFGEERRAPKIARAILEEVRSGALKTTADLADLVRRLSPRGKGRIDPATRTFQALRIWVNDELDHLEKFLERALTRLNPEGRLAVISYHSLEDRRVKQAFRSFAQMQTGFGLLTKKPLRPSAHEAAQNPRARSAKLRGLVRTGG